MKENLPYLIWAYALVGVLITVYSVSLVRRRRRVANELKALAETLKSRNRGQA
ncbi:MAG: CcmD family protein [Myxococcota bacterium]